MRTDSLSLREQIVVGCIEAMETARDELEYVPEIAPSLDEAGRVRPDICDRLYTSTRRQKLCETLAQFCRVFPFPSFGSEPERTRTVAKDSPSFEAWSLFFQDAAMCIPDNLTFEGYSAEEHKEIQARALSLRAAFRRLSIQLEAVRLMLAEGEIDAWTASSPSPRTSH